VQIGMMLDATLPFLRMRMCAVTAFPHHVLRIVAPRPKKQMIGPHAWGIVAVVAAV
jgi:hypothetical protein